MKASQKDHAMRVAAALLPLLLAAPAAAQDPATDPACMNVRVALPPELAGWSQQVPVSAGVKPGEGATISVGQAAIVSLHPAKHLALAPTPKAADGNGGTLSLPITTAGTYRVALGGNAWVDVVQHGKALTSAAHAHGPKCTGVGKIVSFRLAPGNYTIQLSGSDSANMTLLVGKVA
jgi:hypothetical protein